MSRVVGIEEGRKLWSEGVDVELIDRRTRWGNPFKMAHEGEREDAISAYRTLLWAQVKEHEVKLEDLSDLYGKILVCHCAPKACHGDVLLRAAEWARAQVTDGKMTETT